MDKKKGRQEDKEFRKQTADPTIGSAVPAHLPEGRWARFYPGHLVLIARMVLGSVFVYASMDKILHPTGFADIIANYQILPDVLINLTAIILPWLEFFLGLALLFGVWLPGAVFLCNLLLTVFTAALVFNLARGLDVHCGCFGTTIPDDARAPMAWYIFRDLIFFAVGIYLLLGILYKILRKT